MNCYECGERIPDGEDMYNIGGGEYVCEDCRDSYYMYCEDCEEWVHEHDMIVVDHNARSETFYVCEDCSDNYYRCDHCGQLYSEYNTAVNTVTWTLCDSCYSDYFFRCTNCTDVLHLDYCETVDGDYYCASCAEEHRGPILSYSYKPNPLFFGGKTAGYGVELEIDDGKHRQNAARDIQDAAGDHIYIKEDGSLSYKGMEIVTHPATLDYHVNHFPWSDICETALSYGYCSHDTDTCGLHIHASRSLFGNTEIEQDLTIAKIILLVDRWYDSHIVQFARRNINRMRHWAGKPNAGIRPEDSDVQAVEKSKKTANDRYKAVNLCNRNTIEFRFFRGTLRRDTIIASIQWVDTIIRYCRNTPLKDLFNTTWDNIFGNTGHKELTDYLQRRNLYNIKEGN